MKKLNLLPLLLFCISILAQNKQDLSYFLPQDVTFNQSIPIPESILGYQVGEWHPSHDQILNYLTTLASKSNRFYFETKGYTHEKRPLVLITISSPTNLAKLDQIKANHLQLTERDLSTKLDLNTMPLVIYQGFSVHGNEASGINASLFLAYYLAAAQGKDVDELLDKTIILLDPSLNPDGYQRFSGWVNSHKSNYINSDSNDREFNEVWPGGRTNHYWFDLNRDWLVAQQPESQTRLKSFHEWHPNILTDFHEMGTNATYFFQPGIPSATHPLTPILNQQLTKEIASFFAKDLDKIGSTYFTEENFDDFYYGKGSTYPDINGGIGILFEQARASGIAQQSENGLLTFSFAIRNQVTSSIAVLKAGMNLRNSLLNYQRNFYIDAYKKAQTDKTKALVFSDDFDTKKSNLLAQTLIQHHIKIHKLAADYSIKGKTFKQKNSYVIPVEQKNYLLIKSMFEKRIKFTDSLFYDISTWTLPLAFNVSYDSIASTKYIGAEITDFTYKAPPPFEKSDVAYLFQWHNYNTPKAINKILSKGIRVKTSMKTFNQNNSFFDYGTIQIPVQNQLLTSDELHTFLMQVAAETEIEITPVFTSLNEGIDLGSANFNSLKKPKVAILVGEGISGYDAGELWHLFDYKNEINSTKIDINRFSRINLAEYTTLIIPSFVGKFDNQVAEKLREFAQNGGVIVAYKNSIKALNDIKLLNVNLKKVKPETKNVPFDKRRDFRGAQEIGGAIFQVELDRSHPINFGLPTNKMAFFRDTELFITADSTNYKNPIQYSKNPLISGYISKENLNAIGNTIPFKVENVGRGKVIALTDNGNFRAFWLGTEKIIMNIIFFGNLM